MSERPGPGIDPDSTQPLGDVHRFTRRRVGPAKIALAALLAVLITAVGAMVLSVVLWAFASLIH
jgi:hypothetical protein